LSSPEQRDARTPAPAGNCGCFRSPASSFRLNRCAHCSRRSGGLPGRRGAPGRRGRGEIPEVPLGMAPRGAEAAVPASHGGSGRHTASSRGGVVRQLGEHSRCVDGSALESGRVGGRRGGDLGSGTDLVPPE
jgi:hypothetical protein